MDVTDAQANLDSLAYDHRLWEGLRSRTNRYDDTNTGLQKQCNGFRGVPHVVIGSDRRACVCTEATWNIWYECRHTAGGRSPLSDPKLKTLATTFVRYEDVSYCVLEWRPVFAVLRCRTFPDAGAAELYLGSSDGILCHYHVAHHSNRPICRRATSSVVLLGRYSKCLLHAYLSTGYRAHTEIISSNEAYIGAVEDEVERSIAGDIHDSLTSDGSTSPFSTTKGSGCLPESTRVTGPSAYPNPTTRVPDATGAQQYTIHYPGAGIPGPLSSNAPPLPTRSSFSDYPLDLSYEARVRAEHDVCPGRALVTSSRAADQVAFNPSTSIDRATGLVVRPPVKKALVVGINYYHSTVPGVGRLRFAVNDAKRVVRSLKGCGFSQGNVILLTDQRRGRATYDALVESICWLIDDAKAGDTLFFFYSGHGRNDYPPHGAGLHMEDSQVITRRELEDNLVGRVPEGCELHLVIDSCFASSMIKLQYRVKQMAFNYNTGSSAVVVARPTVPASNLPSFLPLTRPVVLTAGLDRSALPKNAIATPQDSVQIIASQARVGGSPTTNAHRTIRHTTPSSVALPFSVTHNEMFYGQYPPPKVGQVQDSFHQRPGEEKIAKPMGRVFFWAGTGEHQNSFESYNAPDARDGVVIQNGIVANALCTALDTFSAKKLVLRHVWQSLSDNIEKENVWRHERDSKKSTAERAKLIPANRIQLAELWVSQHEPSSTTTSVLDQPMFSS